MFGVLRVLVTVIRIVYNILVVLLGVGMTCLLCIGVVLYGVTLYGVVLLVVVYDTYDT